MDGEQEPSPSEQAAAMPGARSPKFAEVKTAIASTSPSGGPEVSRRHSVWSSCVLNLSRFERWINWRLGQWAGLVARQTDRVCGASLLLVLLCCGGWARLPIETQGTKLWIPQDSEVQDTQDYVGTSYGMQYGDELWQADVALVDRATGAEPGRAESYSNGLGVIDVESITQLFGLVDAISSHPFTYKGESTTFAEICTGRSCPRRGALSFWDNDVSRFKAQTYQELVDDVNAHHFPRGGEVIFGELFGGLQFKQGACATPRADGSCLVGASSVRLSMGLPKDYDDDLADAFGAALESAIAERRATLAAAGLEARYIHLDSLDDAISASVVTDIYLIVLAYVVILLVCPAVLAATTHWDGPRGRAVAALVGLAGYATTLLSIAAGYGLCMALGIPFTSVSQLGTFVLVGIGVDDMFVLAKSMDQVDLMHPGLPQAERFKRCVEEGGVSITVTSLTTSIAFLLGSLTSIPAVRWFCWYSVISIVVDWMLQLSLFLCLFKYAEGCTGLHDTQDGSKTDMQAQEPPTEWSIPTTNDNPVEPLRVPSTPAGKSMSSRAPPTPVIRRTSSAMGRALSGGFARFLLHPAVMAGVVGLAFAAWAGGIYALAAPKALEEGLPLEMLAPQDHYLRDWFELMYEYEVSTHIGTVNIYFRDIDLSDPDAQLRALRAWSKAKAMDSFRADVPTTCWISKFIAYAESEAPDAISPEGGVSSARFYPLLHQWLEVTDADGVEVNGAWRQHLSWDGPELQGGLCRLVAVPAAGRHAHWRHIRQDGSIVEAAVNGDDCVHEGGSCAFAPEARAAGRKPVVIYGVGFVFTETDVILKRELFMNVGCALVGVTIVVIAMLVHPVAIILQVLVVLTVDSALLSEMAMFSIRLNTISVINLVLAIGFSIDYSLHVMHRFLETPAPIGGPSTGRAARAARISSTLEGMGTAVLLSASTTAIALLPLAGADSDIFFTFFQLLFANVLIGIFVGLALVPVALVLVGPDFVTSDYLSKSMRAPADPQQVQVIDRDSSEHPPVESN